MTPPHRQLTAREMALAAGLIFVWLASTAWVRPLMLPDEGRYVGVAWEMITSGNWLTPTLNGLPYFHKPPLFYWITASSLSVFGLSEVAARAAPILGAWLGAFSMLLFTARWCGRHAARIMLVALLVQPLFFVGGQFANLDMLVAGCITATILLLADASLSMETQRPHQWSLAAAFAMAGFGVLAKGLIGVVLPALVVGTWLIMRRRWRVLISLLWWPGMLVFLLITAPWFVVMQQRFDGFLDYFFVVQHFKRFAAAGFNNIQPAWFFPALLLISVLPWWPSLARLVKQDYLSDPNRGAIRWLMLLWTIIIVGFFSLPKSKLIGYVLPAVPPLAFLIADAYLLSGSLAIWARRVWWVGCASAAVLSLVVISVVANRPMSLARHVAPEMLALHHPDEPVFLLGRYDFDLPFYARLTRPVVVVDDWKSLEIDRHDNWRRELADAGKFVHVAAERTLITASSFVQAPCSSKVIWVIGSKESGALYPFLTPSNVVSELRGTQLWRVDSLNPELAGSLHCPGRPIGG